MNILAIDTSYKNLIIIATKGDKTCIKQSTDQVKQHNSLILPMIDEILKEIGLDISEIDYFSAVVGPGSFTGIRLGVCTQNAF
ncbi:MAG: tRNA (adenosine(37)-N6)-threonylcarbamoyltransferase complex dimerization subunit type 1 TsaB, partial [Clostridia bacterium]